MGILVDAASFERQLDLTNTTERRSLYFQSLLFSDWLNLSIGEGTGQSRLCFSVCGRPQIIRMVYKVEPPL
jgi:asparagine synthetase A